MKHKSAPPRLKAGAFLLCGRYIQLAKIAPITAKLTKR